MLEHQCWRQLLSIRPPSFLIKKERKMVKELEQTRDKVDQVVEKYNEAKQELDEAIKDHCDKQQEYRKQYDRLLEPIVPGPYSPVEDLHIGIPDWVVYPRFRRRPLLRWTSNNSIQV